MNFLKYHFQKKYLHNKHQVWINLALILLLITVVFCYKPAYNWVADTVENNILLTLTICVLLFIKFVITRIYYISYIQKGKVKARGCAESSCLMTFIMAVCIVILTMKACRQHYTPTHPEEMVKEVACKSLPNSNNDP